MTALHGSQKAAQTRARNARMGKPIPGVEYRLTGGPGVACISNGNTWAESRIEPDVHALADEVRAGRVSFTDAVLGLLS